MLQCVNAHNEGIVTELFDAICIAPYRLVANPVAGFYVGTLVLALASLVLGRLTYDLTWLFNRGHYAKEEAEMVRMLTGYPTLETARQSVQLGACQYCVKPIDKDELERKVEEALADDGR